MKNVADWNIVDKTSPATIALFRSQCSAIATIGKIYSVCRRMSAGVIKSKTNITSIARKLAIKTLLGLNAPGVVRRFKLFKVIGFIEIYPNIRSRPRLVEYLDRAAGFESDTNQASHAAVIS